MNKNSIKKIVVIGPESTGKSTLCEQLARHFKTDWCPEYAREYLLTHGNKYSYEDLLTIAKGQISLEETTCYKLEKKLEASHNARPTAFFIDTDMYVMKVWCEFVFGKCHRYILEQLIERSYDLYLLCKVDLPWVRDELREYPDETTRQKLYSIYLDCMINQKLPWVEISGDYDERLARGIAATEQLLEA